MSIITTYKDLLIESLKDNKKLILGLYALFIAIVIIGWVLANMRMGHLVSGISPSAGSANEMSVIDLLLTNETASLYTYIFSIFFGIIAVYSLFFNALSTGMGWAVFATTTPNGALRFLAYIIPHGIFEITANVIQSAAGILLFYFIFRFVKNIIKSDESDFKGKLAKSFEDNKRILIQSLVLCVFSLILLLIAAPIETYVSMPFSNLLFGPIP